MVSSYFNEAGNVVVSVIVNYGQIENRLLFDVPAAEVESWKPYLTGPGEDEKMKPLESLDPSKEITVPKRSVLTLVGKLKE